MLIGCLVFSLGAVSAILAFATLAGEAVERYGAVIAMAPPVSRLSRNVAWTIVAVLGLLVILNELGLSTTPILTACA